jgi:hypothetical protein
MNLRAYGDLIAALLKLPKLTLSLNDKSLYVHFTRRHRLLVIPNKSLGVALLRLPSNSGGGGGGGLRLSGRFKEAGLAHQLPKSRTFRPQVRRYGAAN